ncbi:MAG: hypothetical protein CVU05_15395, partial [Bacteroidetes bacterium HGW-Bacteroidetes-21]
ERGLYNRIFDKSELFFDVQKGDYSLLTESVRGKVNIQGSGNRYEWTVRAFKRMGFDVGCNIPAPISVIVKDLEQVWEVRAENESFEAGSIKELMLKLNVN